MWIYYIVYTLISIVNVYSISTFTTVTSSKTDNAVFIYPGQVIFFNPINNFDNSSKLFIFFIYTKIKLLFLLRQKVNGI